MEEKTFKERIEELKKNSCLQDMDVSVLDCLPENFYQINDRQLVYLWHHLSDSLIGELYNVPKTEVAKKRHEFGINPVTSAFDGALREIYEIKSWEE